MHGQPGKRNRNAAVACRWSDVYQHTHTHARTHSQVENVSGCNIIAHLLPSNISLRVLLHR